MLFIKCIISPSFTLHQGNPKHQLYSRNGADFADLCRGHVRNYSCSNSVALDPDIMRLLEPTRNILDLYRDVLASHARNILSEIQIR